uniref:hypothetical protein n=1 Tax=Gelidibacter sp. TaxID=2018083 RepID=UPI004049B42D
MIDFTTLQANPIPSPILELQNENLKLEYKNKKLEKIVFSLITTGVLVLIYYTIKNAESRKKK